MRQVAALLVSGCVLAAPATAQTPDRSKAPAPGPAPTFTPPPIQKQQLSNGLTVWIVETHEVPLVQVTLMVEAGSAADPDTKLGLASMTAAMLDEGAGSRSALEIADAIDHLGADLATGSSFDASSVRLSVPARLLDQALPLMADVTLRPTFPAKELERLRQERLTSLLQARDEPGAIVATAFPRLLYGERHRYGTSSGGTAASVRSLSVTDLQEFHTRHYRPDAAALIAVGDITPERIVTALERAFGAWKAAGSAPPQRPVENAPQPDERRVYLIDKPGAAQSEVRIGWIGVARSTPDYFPLEVLNTILGGSFTSRLNQNLREKNGYAYGAGSAFDMRAAAGPFYAAAAVQTDRTAEAVQEFFKELTAIRDPIPAAELEKAKNYIALRFPGAFETSGRIAGSLAEMILYDLPDDYYATYIERIRTVTAADVQRVAARYIQPDKLAVVIVGDLKEIEAGVRKLQLGTARVVPLDEVMGPADEPKTAGRR